MGLRIMAISPGSDMRQPVSRAFWPVLGWGTLGLAFTVPVVCKSLALEAAGRNKARPGSFCCRWAWPEPDSAAGDLLAWHRSQLGNAGLATIASIARLQFLPYRRGSSARSPARCWGRFMCSLMGWEQGACCLFLGVFVALLPRPVLFARAGDAVFAQCIASGQIGLLALVFLAVTIALNEGFAALG